MLNTQVMHHRPPHPADQEQEINFVCKIVPGRRRCCTTTRLVFVKIVKTNYDASQQYHMGFCGDIINAGLRDLRAEERA